MSLEDLDHKEIALLKAALISYRDCPHCQKEYPRTHSIVTTYILPKVRKMANAKFEALTNLDQQITFVEHEKTI